MAVEIERKFLVRNDLWREGDPPGTRFCQGYLSTGDTTVRVRRAGERACITVKGRTTGIARPEYEYAIPVHEAEEMLGSLCKKPLIEKTRYQIQCEGHLWFVDVFGGKNTGLVLAEIELSHLDEAFATPSWVGAEVTHDPNYRNSAMSIRWDIARGSPLAA